MITFGTDGWRAVISEEFTFGNVQTVSQAIADFFNETTGASIRKRKRIIVGYDTRFLSPTYARLIAEVLSGNELNVLLVDRPTPTPSVCVAIKNQKLIGGVIVTASHNPYNFSGIKIKANYGGPATPEMTKQVESLLNKSQIRWRSLEDSLKTGRVVVAEVEKEYITTVRDYLDMKAIKKGRYNILVDSMGGAGTRLIEKILRGSSIKIDTIHGEPDPMFGRVNPEPIPHNLKTLLRLMRTGKYDLAIANDGDADRIGAFTALGRFITPGQILGLLILHFKEHKGWSGAVVKTVSNSTMINKICEALGIKLYETPVGFKHICALMQEKKILAGGEESGGIGVANYAPERDGMLLGLLLLEIMAIRKKPIHELIGEMERRFGKFRYDRVDVHYPNEKKPILMQKLKNDPPKKLLGVTIKEVRTSDGVKYIADDLSWLLLRLSGTEPILRIYAESGSVNRTKKLLQFGQQLAYSV
ncbi:MAG: phosphoglucomutase/phosphomannomutase family protein [Candidatus Omnitrophica bacterium]|nr:phosphoglucomutase/phosphomannomutase family protein [Candidatus Omnitrophota bacterium]